MINKIILLLYVLLALSGCGSPHDPIDSDFVWEETKACTDLGGSKPQIQYIDDAIWPFKDSAGLYKPSEQLVIIRSSFADNFDVLAHEFIHHLLGSNGVDIDICHSGGLFAACAPTTAGSSC